MAGRVRKFVSREFARTVYLDLLARFLSSHADVIGLDWDALPRDDNATRDAIYEFFRGADDRLPAELQDALHRASILSTPRETRLLLEQANERGV